MSISSLSQLPDTEARILKAAESEFLRKGFSAARTTSIAEAAGVTHTMLHYYFRTKEKLFDKVIAEKLLAVAQSFIIPFSDEEMSLKDCLVQGMSQHFDFIMNNPTLPRFILREMDSNPELILQFSEKIKETAGEVIVKFQQRIDRSAGKGECVPADASEIILDIVSLNIFSVIAAPVFSNIFGAESPDDYSKMLLKRKEVNIATILKKLKINDI